MAFCVNCGEKLQIEQNSALTVVLLLQKPMRTIKISHSVCWKMKPRSVLTGEIISSYEDECPACGFESQNQQPPAIVQEFTPIYVENEPTIWEILEDHIRGRHLLIAIPVLLLFIGGMLAGMFASSVPSGIHPPISASETDGKNYAVVVRQFKDAGFTNVGTEKIEDLITGWLTKDGEIEQIAIEGETDFKKWDSFRADAKVVVSYHTFSRGKTTTYESSGSNQAGAKTDAYNSKTGLPNNDVQTDKSVSYSTNDRETAKNGNSGVFAYKNIGGTYDIYWIIDFDEGYVYYFTDGNGDASCHRLKIDSGDLNSVLIITYHDGDDVWSYGLHFNWKNQPDTLILQDNNGFETKFVTTNLSKALEIRDSKTIIDY